MSKASIIARAAATLGVLTATVSGVTMAALQSTATLSDNTVSSATAALQVANTVPCADATFGASATGFNFSGIVPGGATSATQHFCLKNNGTANMGVTVAIPTLPTYTDSTASPVTVDNSKVHVSLACTGLTTVNTTIQALWATGETVGTVNAGVTVQCDAVVSMDANAFVGTNVTSTGFDLLFTGTGI